MRKFLMLSVAIGGMAVAGCSQEAAAPTEETTTDVAPAEGAMEAPAEGAMEAPAEGAMEAPAEGAAPAGDAAPADAGESSGGGRI